MKNLLKITVISSLLIVACLLISACGDDTENFVQGNGKIDVTVTNSAGLALPGVQIEIRKVSVTDPNIVSRGTTDSLGKATFQETIATDYYFTFIAAGYATQNYVNNPVRPELTVTKTVNVVMVP